MKILVNIRYTLETINDQSSEMTSPPPLYVIVRIYVLDNYYISKMSHDIY